MEKIRHDQAQRTGNGGVSAIGSAMAAGFMGISQCDRMTPGGMENSKADRNANG
jgi:hypothetical protein